MVAHNPVADSFAVGHNLVGDSLVEGIPAGDNFVVAHTPAEDILAVDHIPAESNLVGHIPGEDSPVVAHTPVADNFARDSPVVVDSLVVAAHTPAVLYSVAGIAVFRLAVDSFAAARNLVADNFVAAADSSFGFVRAAAALLPVVRNTCKTALRPATAGNNVYNA